MNNISAASYLRTFVFGVEDSLVSTVGLLSGVALAALPGREIVLTGVVLVFVESFSMAVGEYLSERSATDLSKTDGLHPVAAAGLMFGSYFLSGFIPLGPYLLLPPDRAFPLSIILSLAALFLLGAFGARIARRRLFPRALRMLLVGGAAILVGILAGRIAR